MTAAAALLSRLQECMRRVPEGVNNGSYQKALNYKAWYKEAARIVKKNTTNEQTLMSLINQYEGFK